MDQEFLEDGSPTLFCQNNNFEIEFWSTIIASGRIVITAKNIQI